MAAGRPYGSGGFDPLDIEHVEIGSRSHDPDLLAKKMPAGSAAIQAPLSAVGDTQHGVRTIAKQDADQFVPRATWHVICALHACAVLGPAPGLGFLGSRTPS